jgi:hypothetical protein
MIRATPVRRRGASTLGNADFSGIGCSMWAYSKVALGCTNLGAALPLANL